MTVYVANLRIKYMIIFVTPRRMESEGMLICRFQLMHIAINFKCHQQGLRRSKETSILEQKMKKKKYNAMTKIYAIFCSGTLQHLQDDDGVVEKTE
jgi:hypothetical protein